MLFAQISHSFACTALLTAASLPVQPYIPNEINPILACTAELTLILNHGSHSRDTAGQSHPLLRSTAGPDYDYIER